MLWIIRDPSKMLNKEPRGRSSRKVGIYCLYTYWKGLKRFQYFIHRNLDCLSEGQEIQRFGENLSRTLRSHSGHL